MERKCLKCGEVKHITQFVSQRKKANGKVYRRHTCYKCWSKLCLERYYRKRPEILARMKKRYAENKYLKDEVKLRKFEKILGHR